MAQRIPPSRRAECAACKKITWRSRTSAAVQYCLECRRAGKAPSNRSHGRGGYRSGCRCEVCREAQRTAQQEYVARKKAADPNWSTSQYKPKRPERPCRQCGDPLSASRGGIGVHKKCRERWDRAEAKRRAAAKRLERAAAGIPANPNNPFTAGVCRYCCESFVRRNTPSPYCSSECRRRDKPRPVRASTRREVLERDGWVCQLCSEPIDREAHYLDDWSATVDHIVPQSKGGTHEPENLRACHRWCNAVRGNESYYSAADLAA